MSNTTGEQESLPQTKRGSNLQGTTIKAVGHRLCFDIPTAWVRWYEENETHRNLHLTAAELDEVRETQDEWDREFALVVNAILPFDQCIAHVGGDGWGPRGISYADLQVRVYFLTATPEEIEERVRSQGSVFVASLTGTPVVPKQEKIGAWRRTVFKYFRTYIDYGATAIVDVRLRLLSNRTVVFAFMYTDHTEHDVEIGMILNSTR